MKPLPHAGAPYERPNQSWMCGRAAAGCPCVAGPDSRGRCPLAEARCQPVLSLAARRRRLSLLLLAAATGLLAIASAGSWGWRVFSPGPLASAHAHLDLPEEGAGCVACHGAAELTWSAWLRPPSHPDVTDGNSARCLRCHDLGPHAFKSHAVDPTALRPPRDAAPDPARPAADYPCATCHTEHRGSESPPLAAGLDAVRCQACHASRFASFASDHPEFRRADTASHRRIRFDHARHESRHFLAQNNGIADREFLCLNCHTIEPASGEPVLADYELACGACHDKGIGDNKGLRFLAVQGIESDALAGTIQAIGAWANEEEADVAPLTYALLSADPESSPGLQLLVDIDSLDLSGATTEEREAVADYAWALKRLFVDIEREGHAALARRLAMRLGVGEEAPVIRDALGQFPPSLAALANRTWFATAAAELAARAPDGSISAARAAPALSLTWPDVEASAGGGWFIEPYDYSVRYRPVRHADPFVRAWIEIAGAGESDDFLGPWLADTLAAPTSPGRCTKCHDAPRGPIGSADWGAWRDGGKPTASRFPHRPHLGARGGARASCSTCHRVTTEPRGDGLSVIGETSDFLPWTIASCRECHAAAGAPARCLDCHDYHFVRPAPRP